MRLHRPHFPTLSFRPRRPFAGRSLSLFPEREASPMRRVVLLAAWGIVVFSLCLGSRLASDRFADFLRQGPPPETGLRLVTAEVAPLAFPPGATVKAMSLLKADNQPLVNMSDATLRLSLWSLLTGRLGIALRGDIGEGSIDGTVATGFLFDTSGIKVDADLRALPLAHIPAATGWDGALKGTIDGSVYVNADLARPLAGDMDIDLTAIGLDIKNIIPLLAPNRLPAMDLKLVADSSDGMLTVEGVEITGKEIRITGGGKAGLNPDAPGKSTLDFGARIKIPANMVLAQLVRPEDYKRLQRGKDVDVTLSGTIERPRLDRR